MAEATSAIPVGVYPYLSVKGGKAALDFYSRAFGATEEFRNYGEDGERIMHARFRVNGQAILLSDDFPEFRGGIEAPPPAGVTIHLEVDNADQWWDRAVAPARRSARRWPTNSGATATASCAIRLGTAGRSVRR